MKTKHFVAWVGVVAVSSAGVWLSAAPQAPAPAAPVAATNAAAGLLGSHKQLAWWILNIAIVLIAALAISRRMS